MKNIHDKENGGKPDKFKYSQWNVEKNGMFVRWIFLLLDVFTHTSFIFETQKIIVQKTPNALFLIHEEEVRMMKIDFALVHRN